MKLRSHIRRRPARRSVAFTLVEIALCIGIIGFALVAIIGILPAGLQVQRDNREDTIINQEGIYYIEAIRNGAQDLHHLDGMVRVIEFWRSSGMFRATNNQPGSNVIAFLSRPSQRPMVDDPLQIAPVEVRAIVRPISGSAVEGASEIAFEYQMIVRNFALTNYSPDLDPRIGTNLINYAREVRLELRWPVLPGDRVGSGRQVFRAVIGGTLQRDPRAVQADGTVLDDDRWLFRQ